MRLLDAHRRQKKAEAEAQAHLEQQTLRRSRRREVAEALARAIQRGDVELPAATVVTLLPEHVNGPLGGESERLYVRIGSDTFIVNVYAHGVMTEPVQ